MIWLGHMDICRGPEQSQGGGRVQSVGQEKLDLRWERIGGSLPECNANKSEGHTWQAKGRSLKKGRRRSFSEYSQAGAFCQAANSPWARSSGHWFSFYASREKSGRCLISRRRKDLPLLRTRNKKTYIFFFSSFLLPGLFTKCCKAKNKNTLRSLQPETDASSPAPAANIPGGAYVKELRQVYGSFFFLSPDWP